MLIVLEVLIKYCSLDLTSELPFYINMKIRITQCKKWCQNKTTVTDKYTRCNGWSTK